MKIQLIRFSSQADSTSGILLIDNEFACYTLEDEEREVKVMDETCIPEGTYEIKYRKEGGFHSRYSARYGSDHFGMLELQDVPGFKFILIHSGNTDEHTSGCVLLGDQQKNNIIYKDGFIGESRNAYSRVYKTISKALNNNEKVTIEIKKLNNNKPSNKQTDYIPGNIPLSKKLNKIEALLIELIAANGGRKIV